MITRVKEGLKAEITLDALPGESFSGKVKSVSPVADSEQRWLNPNLKVYHTEITIEGNHPNLKPGMSTEVRVIVDEIKDVVMVPLQAVTTHGDESICFVMNSGRPAKRVIETGDYNDKYIEIVSGLTEGEKVILNIGRLVEGLEPVESTGTKKPIRRKRAGDEATTDTTAVDTVTTGAAHDDSSTSPALAGGSTLGGAR